MKKIISVVLVLVTLSGLFMAFASAAGVPSTCPRSDCSASIKVVRYGQEYTLKVGERTVGNAVYYIFETRQGYSVVCNNNHGSDDYLVLDRFEELAYYI